MFLCVEIVMIFGSIVVEMDCFCVLIIVNNFLIYVVDGSY